MGFMDKIKEVVGIEIEEELEEFRRALRTNDIRIFLIKTLDIGLGPDRLQTGTFALRIALGDGDEQIAAAHGHCRRFCPCHRPLPD